MDGLFLCILCFVIKIILTGFNVRITIIYEGHKFWLAKYLV